MPLVVGGSVVSLEFAAQSAKADAAIKSLYDNLIKLDQSFTDFQKTGEKNRQEAEKSTLSFTELNSAFELVSKAVEQLQKVYDFSKMGAMNERMIESGNEMARQFGGSMDEIIAKVKEASLGTVSDLDIIASANKAMMLGLGADADQLANLMEIAAFRGRAMGLTTTQAFDDIVRGIGRNSPLILDNLGIITKGWSEEAKAAGVAYDQQFILNKVLEQGNDMLTEAGGLTRDAASEYEIFEANLANAKVEMQNAVSEGFTPLIKAYNDLYESRSRDQDSLDTYNESMNTTLSTTSQAYRYGASYRDEVDRIANMMQRGAAMTEFYNQQVQASSDAVENAQQATASYVPDLEKVLSLTGSIASENQKFADKQADVAAKQEEIKAKIADLTAQGYPAWSQKIIDLQTDYDNLGMKYAENAEAHAQAMGKIQYDLLVTKLSADGLTEAEYAIAQQAGIMFGQFDQGTADTARNFDMVAQAVADGRIAVEDMGKAIDLLPTYKNIDILVNAIVNMRIAEAQQNSYIQRDQNQQAGRTYSGYAEGGIARGPDSGHWELLHGDEAVIPLKNGSVPVSLGGGGGGGGGGMTLVIQVNSPVSLFGQEEVDNILLPAFERGYRELQAKGIAQ